MAEKWGSQLFTGSSSLIRGFSFKYFSNAPPADCLIRPSMQMEDVSLHYL
jgi:hypothetical protein